jgi:large subunit ribosomal protein L18
MTMETKEKQRRQLRRHLRLRRRVVGTSARPRLCVSRSHKHIAAQVVDDTQGRTLLGLSTQSAAVRAGLPRGGNVQAAQAIGAKLAELARARGITKVAFDRGGYRYHGRVKALAEAARAGGLEF